MIAEKCHQMNNRPPEHPDSYYDLFEPSCFTGIVRDHRYEKEVDCSLSLELEICEEEFLSTPKTWPYSE